MATYSKLFSSVKIGSLKLKNRLVMPPMVRNYADASGKATDRFVAHVDRIAQGGVGLMILEASFVSTEGRGFLHELGVHHDSVIPGLKKLAKAAHDQKAAIAIQLYHAGRQTSSKITKKKPVAPSPIPCPIMQERPKTLSVKDINRLVTAFGKAAGRAKKAGFDAVEIHGAHGYLIQQFLSPFSNQRKDAYGGSFENRMRFLLEVYEAVRSEVGSKFPVIVRLSGEEMVEGGLMIKDMVKVAKELEKAGANALHISSGNYGSYPEGHLIPPMAVKDGVNIPLAKAIKKVVKIPVIAVGKIRTPELAEKTLKDGSADFIAIGRSLLADPDWPMKAKKGLTKEIVPCIACNQGCISRLFAQEDVWCTVNPACGREALFAKPASSKKKLLVVGGGPAGMSAAITAAERGHEVVLMEESSELGGQLNAASKAPLRGDWETLRKSLISRLKKSSVDVQLDAPVTFDQIKDQGFDTAIVAIGSSAKHPNIPGIDKECVVIARDLFEGKAEATGDVVVVGGGCMGAQTAEFLAAKNHKVTLVEYTDQIALEAPMDDRHLLLKRLETYGVKIKTQTKVLKINKDGVFVLTGNDRYNIHAQTVVICLGSAPNDSLTYKLKFVIKDVRVIGDAKSPRRVTDAVIEGGLAAVEL